MKTVKYTKLNGAGNDFVLIDRKLNPDFEISPEIVKKLADRTAGIGADGVIFIEDDENCDFEMLYYNADGTTGSLCGNGARCAIKYAQLTDRIGSAARFKNINRMYTGEVLEETVVKFFLNSPSKIKLDFKVKALDQLINSHFVDVGSPHVVIFIKNVLKNKNNLNSFYNEIENFPVFEAGREIRRLPEFAPEGVNVNFINIKNEEILIRSYEKGVEEETLACGTGAVASAIIANLKKLIETPVRLITKSNSVLTVDFKLRNDRVENLSLTGPVEIEFNGEYSI